MVEKYPVFELTQDSYNVLLLEASNNPKLWLDPEADFHKLLLDRGITEYKVETGVYSDRPIALIPVNSSPLNRADRQALDFYRSFDGMTPSAATNERVWAWMTHFRLHSYGLKPLGQTG